mmetsp:Transcript_5332/g.6987  ORF Transcript_5332/g.6987 Transcript_5332/m.6987 type:complete len:289 (+) Transcript_5332:601-1467(+)
MKQVNIVTLRHRQSVDPLHQELENLHSLKSDTAEVMVLMRRLNAVMRQTPPMSVTLTTVLSTPTHHRKVPKTVKVKVVHLLSRNRPLTRVTTIRHMLPIHQHLPRRITTIRLTPPPRRHMSRRTDHIIPTAALMPPTIHHILIPRPVGRQILINNFMVVDLGIVLIHQVHPILLHLTLMTTGTTDIRRIPSHPIHPNTIILIKTTIHPMDNTEEDTTTVHTLMKVVIRIMATTFHLITTMTFIRFSRIITRIPLRILLHQVISLATRPQNRHPQELCYPRRLQKLILK